MSDTKAQSQTKYNSVKFNSRLRARHRSDRVMIGVSLSALILALIFLVFFLTDIVRQGYSAFVMTEFRFDLTFSENVISSDSGNTEEAIRNADFGELIEHALQERFGPVEGREAESRLEDMVTRGAALLLERKVTADPNLIGTTEGVWLPASDEVDQIVKGNQPRDIPEERRKVSDRQLAWLDELEEAGDMRMAINWAFFTGTDSRDPAMAGLWGALVGSVMTLAVTLIVSFPVAVAAAIYLEEFAPETWWTRIIEVNINNLAAVPSIIFGLLGLTVFINWLGMPRSAPLVGGLVLALMTLPIIIVAARSALKAVPNSVREASLQLGASRQLTVFRQVLPVAMPSMLTGTIIGMAQALGETAPLILIGMIAFVSSVPDGVTESATVLPAQIYIWFANPEVAYRERAAGAIIVLLSLMLLMNGAAIWLRARLQSKDN